MLQLVFCVLLSAGLLLLALMLGLSVRTRAASRCARRAGVVGRAARARGADRPPRPARRDLGRGRGGAAGALRRRVDRRRCAPRWTPTRGCWRRIEPTADAARGLPRPSATSRRRSPRSISRCGTTRRAGRRRRSRTLIDPRAVGAVPVNATIGAEDRAGAAAAAAAAARHGLPLREGQGRGRRRRRAPRRRPRRRRAGGRRSASTPTAPGRRRRRRSRTSARSAPVGLELCEEPVHGVDALRAVRARDAGADRDGRDARARRPAPPTPSA